MPTLVHFEIASDDIERAKSSTAAYLAASWKGQQPLYSVMNYIDVESIEEY